MEDSQWALTIRDLLEKENRDGGDLKDLPCPFCEKPRSQRSDYVRCQPCGINWLPGEEMDKDPRNARMAALLATAPKKPIPAQ